MKKWHYPFLAFLIIGSYFILTEGRSGKDGDKPGKTEYLHSSGAVFGTSYNATYLSDRDLSHEIRQAMDSVDMALSMFNSGSTISKVNGSDGMQVTDDMFLGIFRRAMEISRLTGGAFDITVAPAVNAWGFGFKNSVPVAPNTIDSLKEIIGYWKIHEDNGFISKDDSRIMLDCSAIAKGYGSDMVARTLEANGVNDYMIEIGGEIVVAGKNPRGEEWSIGVNKPIDDTLSVRTELDTILHVTDIAMATSGNYRNFYVKDGKKYAHTIDPATCQPVSHSLLSATVLALDCATADALATSMMVMGLDSAVSLCRRLPEIKAYLIYQDSLGEMKAYKANM